MSDSESSQSSYSSKDEPLPVGIPPPPPSEVPAPPPKLVIIEIPASQEEHSPEEGPNPAVPNPDREPSGTPEVPYGRKLLFYFLVKFIRICRSILNCFSRQENVDGDVREKSTVVLPVNPTQALIYPIRDPLWRWFLRCVLHRIYTHG